MPAQSARRRTLAGQDIWLADSDAPDRGRLAARALAGLGLPAAGWSLGHDALGRPLLLGSDGAELPLRLSFSRLGGRLWAAASPAPGLGLDVAAPENFAPPYPAARAFAPEDVAAAHGLGLAGQDALALLWSLKEAAAKALGTGFHRVEPLELRAQNFRQTPLGLACEVHGPAITLPALAERLPCGWLALAVPTETGASS